MGTTMMTVLLAVFAVSRLVEAWPGRAAMSWWRHRRSPAHPRPWLGTTRCEW